MRTSGGNMMVMDLVFQISVMIVIVMVVIMMVVVKRINVVYVLSIMVNVSMVVLEPEFFSGVSKRLFKRIGVANHLILGRTTVATGVSSTLSDRSRSLDGFMGQIENRPLSGSHMEQGGAFGHFSRGDHVCVGRVGEGRILVMHVMVSTMDVTVGSCLGVGTWWW